MGPTLGTDRRGDVADARATRARWPWLVALVLAIAWAAYVGFRLPNLWSVTLYNVAWSDGTARRALFGTVLAPLWSVGGNEYWVYAAVAFAILGALLTVIVVVAMRARWTAQRIVILAWLVAPTGAYLFHEVGYLDQLVYLLLFASMWLWTRTSPFVAVLPVVASVLVHELVLLTTWPILVWWAWRAGIARRGVIALLVPLGVGVALVALPPMTAGQVGELKDRLTASLPFPIRDSAVELYGRTLGESWAEYYSPTTGLVAVLAFAAVIAVSWLAILAAARPGCTPSRRWAVWSLPVMVAPLALVLGGADTWRWVFLAFGNLAIVLVLWLAECSAPPRPVAVAAMLVPFLVLVVLPLQYFDGLVPRALTPDGVSRVLEDPDFLTFPER